MLSQFTSSIVGILTTKGTIVGAGFLTAEKYILTCAHVVAQALGVPNNNPKAPVSTIYLTFPWIVHAENSAQMELTGHVIFWRQVSNPSKPGSDIAVLKLDSDPPEGCCASRLVAEDDLWGHSFKTLGFPGASGNCASAKGIIRDKIPNGRVVIEDINTIGFTVTQGFSGAPVWDNQINGIVGMIVAAEKYSDIRTAYMIPSTLLINTCPILEQHTIPPSPYRGLNVFREKDAPFFFGREVFTKLLVEAVHNKSLVAVIGPSGSGKSSIVFAGLIPALRSEESWLIASFRPGNRPFNNLASSLIKLLEPQTNEIDCIVEKRKLAKMLRQGNHALMDAVELIIQKNSNVANLLLVVDQFEELFTSCQDLEKRQCFINELVAAVQMGSNTNRQTNGQNFTLVITIRADFLNYALSYRSLADVLQCNDLKLGPMTCQELQDAIKKPIEKINVKIEDGLTERIMESLSQNSGRLPLLEFSLTLLWEKQENNKLTHAVYNEIGGVGNALSGYAENVYSRFNEEEQKKIRRIFIQLVCPREDSEDTGRIATRSEVGVNNWELVTRLADSRLVICGQDVATGEEIVEMAHEALIRGWNRLREWMKANHSFRAWQEQLRVIIHQWEQNNHDEGALLRGGPLGAAEDWLKSHYTVLSELERGFIQTSINFQTRMQAARDRQRLFITLGTTVGLLIALTLAGLTSLQWWRAENHRQVAEKQQKIAEENKQYAEKQRQLAIARQLSAQAELIINQRKSQLSCGILLAVEAMQRFPSLETDQILRKGLSLLPRAAVCIENDIEIDHVIYSRDGKYLATSSDDNTVRVWDATSGTQITSMKHPYKVKEIIFSPDGKFLVTVSDDRSTRIWETINAKQVAYMKHEAKVKLIIFSPDGKYLVTVTGDEYIHGMEFSRDKIIIWNVSSGQKIDTVYNELVCSATFSRDGSYLALAANNGIIRIFKFKSATPQYFSCIRASVSFPPVGDTGYRIALDFSLDGKYLATASDKDYIARVWEITKRSETLRDIPCELYVDQEENKIFIMKHRNNVRDIVYSPDGKYLATASDDCTARIWNAASGGQIACMQHEDKVSRVVFSRDGKYLATVSYYNTARIWDTTNWQLVTCVEGINKLKSFDFSPEGKYFATASDNGIIQIWEINVGKGVICMEHDDKVKLAVFSPDGKYLATASDDDSARVWDITSGIQIACMENRKIIRRYGFTPRGSSLGFDSSMPLAAFRIENTYINIKFSPNGRYLATAGFDPARILEIKSGKVIEIGMYNIERFTTAITFSPDGKYLARADDNGNTQVWEITSGQEIVCIKHKCWAMDLVFSPDSRYLTTANLDGTARIWEVTSGQEIACIRSKEQTLAKFKKFSDLNPLNSPQLNPLLSPQEIWSHIPNIEYLAKANVVTSIDYSPDGKYLAIANDDYTARLWEVDSGQEIVCMKHEDRVWKVLFSPDGKYLATISDDKTARLWKMNTGKEVACMKHENKGIRAVAFNPSGEYLATAGEDNTARIWRVGSGQEVARINHDDNVNAVTFSSNGKYLATASDDYVASIWNWQPTDIIEEACAQLRRNLTSEEWHKYIGDERYCKTCPNLP